MNFVRTPLLFEIIRYDARLLFTLTSTNKGMQKTLSKAIDYVQTMIEEIYGRNVRDRNWTEC